MVWVEVKAVWFFLPALDDVFIRSESVKGFETLGVIASVQKTMEMLLKLLMVFVAIPLYGCRF